MEQRSRAGIGDVWVKSIGERRGAPRLFFDGHQAVRTRFAPGERFEVVVEGSRVTLTKKIDGSHTVSGRDTKDGERLPVIDVNSKELLGVFEGMGSIRVIVDKDRVHLLPLASEVNRRERMSRLKAKMAAGLALNMGSLSHGGGVLSHAIHQGLADAGVKSDLRFANDIRDDLLLQAAQANSAWSENTRAICMPMQEVAVDEYLLDSLPKLEILELGIPCSGASKAGAAKRGLTKMEDHPEVGHLVHAALVIVQKSQAAIVAIECVPEYASSASAQILRHQLRDAGYDVHEAVLDGADFGCMENRVRWCMVAVTRGMGFDFKQIEPPVHIVQKLKDVLDPTISDDDPRWRSYDYIFDKAARDKEAGKGFKAQLITEDSTNIPTLRKGYHKAGTTDPLLVHPRNPGRFRILTGDEHCLVKQIPVALIDGMSEIQKHQLLGQSIVYPVFYAVGKRVGERCIELRDSMPRSDFEDVDSQTTDRRLRPTG